jgi:sensor domain CHASE-containing protein
MVELLSSENLLIFSNMLVVLTAIILSAITYHATHTEENKHEERMQALANEKEIVERLDNVKALKKALEEAKDGKPFAEIAAEIEEKENDDVRN